MLAKCVPTILEFNSNQRFSLGRIQNLTCSRSLVHITAKQVISRRERTGSSAKCPKMTNVRAEHAKLLFFIVKYANLWHSCYRCCGGCLEWLWNEIFILIQKSFQNDKEWRIFYCDSTLGCRVIQHFDLCKLDDLWCHRVVTKWCKITKNWISLTTFSG